MLRAIRRYVSCLSLRKKSALFEVHYSELLAACDTLAADTDIAGYCPILRAALLKLNPDHDLLAQQLQDYKKLSWWSWLKYFLGFGSKNHIQIITNLQQSARVFIATVQTISFQCLGYLDHFIQFIQDINDDLSYVEDFINTKKRSLEYLIIKLSNMFGEKHPYFYYYKMIYRDQQDPSLANKADFPKNFSEYRTKRIGDLMAEVHETDPKIIAKRRLDKDQHPRFYYDEIAELRLLATADKRAAVVKIKKKFKVDCHPFFAEEIRYLKKVVILNLMRLMSFSGSLGAALETHKKSVSKLYQKNKAHPVAYHYAFFLLNQDNENQKNTRAIFIILEKLVAEKYAAAIEMQAMLIAQFLKLSIDTSININISTDIQAYLRGYFDHFEDQSAIEIHVKKLLMIVKEVNKTQKELIKFIDKAKINLGRLVSGSQEAIALAADINGLEDRLSRMNLAFVFIREMSFLFRNKLPSAHEYQQPLSEIIHDEDIASAPAHLSIHNDVSLRQMVSAPDSPSLLSIATTAASIENSSDSDEEDDYVNDCMRGDHDSLSPNSPRPIGERQRYHSAI